MKAWLYNGRVVFLPLNGATALPDPVEQTDRAVGADEEAGPVDSVRVEGGVVKITRKVRGKSARTKAKEAMAKPNSGLPEIRAALALLLQ